MTAYGDPDENRTRVTAVKGRCLNRLTTGPYMRTAEAVVFYMGTAEAVIFKNGSGSGI